MFAFFFNDTPPPEIYTLSLHDALPIFISERYVPSAACIGRCRDCGFTRSVSPAKDEGNCRSEEHTSELQSLRHLVCRLLLEKKTIRDFSVGLSCERRRSPLSPVRRAGP